jgi:hypothetical protein
LKVAARARTGGMNRGGRQRQEGMTTWKKIREMQNTPGSPWNSVGLFRGLRREPSVHGSWRGGGRPARGGMLSRSNCAGLPGSNGAVRQPRSGPARRLGRERAGAADEGPDLSSSLRLQLTHAACWVARPDSDAAALLFFRVGHGGRDGANLRFGWQGGLSVRSMGLTSSEHSRGGQTDPLRHQRLRISGSRPHGTAGRQSQPDLRGWPLAGCESCASTRHRMPTDPTGTGGRERPEGGA